jgi:hypothetical protein
MDKPDLDRWCREKGYPLITLLSEPRAAMLDGWELNFNYLSAARKAGAANIRKAADKSVYGLLLEISERDYATISAKEGAPNHYEEVKPPVTVRLLDGDVSVAGVKTFRVIKALEQKEFQQPSNSYLELIIRAAERYNFPEWYIAQLKALLK